MVGHTYAFTCLLYSMVSMNEITKNINIINLYLSK
jgi:hypothetical protein